MWGKEKKEAFPYNEVTIKLEELLIFFFTLFFLFFFQFKFFFVIVNKNIFFCKFYIASPGNLNTMHVCARVYVCTNVDKVLDFKVHEVKNWHKYPHVIHLGLWVATIYCLNYFADGLR